MNSTYTQHLAEFKDKFSDLCARKFCLKTQMIDEEDPIRCILLLASVEQLKRTSIE